VIGPVPHYAAGKWSTGPAWIDSHWAGPGQDSGCPVRGYRRFPVTHLGMECAVEVWLWERSQDADVPAFLAEISDGSRSWFVSAASLPDAVELLSHWASVVSAEILTTVYRELTDGWESRHGVLSSALALARANEVEIDREHHRVLRERDEARRQRAQQRVERQRQAMPAGPPPDGPPWGRVP
jgi:hypothetical protein